MFDYAKKIREYRERKCLRSANELNQCELFSVLLGLRASIRGSGEEKDETLFEKNEQERAIKTSFYAILHLRFKTILIMAR